MIRNVLCRDLRLDVSDGLLNMSNPAGKCGGRVAEDSSLFLAGQVLRLLFLMCLMHSIITLDFKTES